MNGVRLREATEADRSAIWAIMEPTIRAGETYALDRDATRQDAFGFWFAPSTEVFVAETSGDGVVGTYRLAPNHAGGGSHVANCGYMTSSKASGRGIGAAMCAHSLERARELGYRAMQFNFVVSTNARAIALWKRFGFEEVGRLPNAFLHPEKGYVDVLVMYRPL